MTEKILTKSEFDLKLAAAALHYKAFKDVKSAIEVADLVLMAADNKVLGEIKVREEE